MIFPDEKIFDNQKLLFTACHPAAPKKERHGAQTKLAKTAGIPLAELRALLQVDLDLVDAKTKMKVWEKAQQEFEASTKTVFKTIIDGKEVN